MEEEIHKEAKIVAKSSITLLFSQAIAATSTFIFMIIAGRYLSTLQYGMFSEIWTVMVLLSSIISTGPTYSVMKYVPEYLSTNEIQKAKTIFFAACKQTAFWSCLCAALVVLASRFLANSVFSPESLGAIRLVGVTLPLFSLSPVLLARFVAYRTLKPHLKANTIGSVFKLALAPILLSSTNIFGGLLSLVLGVIASVVACLFLIPKKLSLHFKEFLSLKSVDISTKVFKFSLPLTLVAITSLFLRQGYILFIGSMHSKEGAGLFSAAFVLISPLYLAMGAFGSSLIPTFSKYWAINEKEQCARIQSVSIKYLLWLTLPIIAPYLVLPAQLLKLTFGSEYESAANTLIFLSLGSLVLVVYMVLCSLLYGLGRVVDILKISVFTLVWCFLSGFILIKLYGVVGAAMASATSCCVQVIFSLYYANKLVRFDYTIIKPFAPLLAFGVNLLVLFYLNFWADSYLSLFGLILLGIGAYSFTMLIIGAVEKQDRQLILRLFGLSQRNN